MKGDLLHTEQIILWDTAYGRTHCKLMDVMKKRKINISTLSRITGLKYDVILRYFEDKITKYDANVLAKLCYSLDCEINDVLVYRRSEW